jgi:chloramphenicol 3-O-phosphotransferase
MVPLLRIRDGVDLVLITGGPGAAKSTVAKILYCAQSPEWRMLSLDDYFYLQGRSGPPGGDAWDTFEANAEVRGLVIKYIGDRHGRVIAEGIIQSDREVDVYSAAMGTTHSSARIRLVTLTCSRATAAQRMAARPVGERSQERWSLEQYAGHYDWLTRKLAARGGTSVRTDNLTPQEIARRVIDAVNADATQ